MWCAINEKGELVYAQDIERKGIIGGDYTCPKCGQALSFHKRPGARAHFKHLKAKKPFLNESKQHLQAKTDLAKCLKAKGFDTELEVIFSNLSKERRADVLVRTSECTFTLEVQYSLIGRREVEAREADYLNYGIHVLWLLGEGKQYDITKHNLNRLAPFLCYSKEWGFYLPYYRNKIAAVVIKCLDLLGNEWQTLTIRPEAYLRLVSAQKMGKPYTIHYPKVLNTNKRRHWQFYRNLQKRDQEILRSPRKYEQIFLERLYQRGLSLQEIPPTLRLVKESCLLVEEPLWLVLAYLYLSKQSCKKMIEKEKIRAVSELLTLRSSAKLNQGQLISWLIALQQSMGALKLSLT